MEGKNITMADMVIRIIQENQLAAGEEDLILEMLGARSRERYEKQGCRCLAEYAEKEMGMLAERKEKDIREKSRRLSRQCLRESRIGSMDITELSPADIRKLIILTAEANILNGEDTQLFLAMMQYTLNVLGRKGVLGFVPPVAWSRNQAARTVFIDNPYTPEEVQKITEWIDDNPQDIRGLAVGLWLASEITPEEIAGLKKESLMDSDGICTGNPTVIKKNEAEDYIALTERRKKIIRNALRLHGDRNLEYIFMSGNEGEWKKISGRCLPLKMSFICRNIGIKYKSFRCSEAVRCHEE